LTLLVIGAAFFAIGLTLTLGENCVDGCERLGFILAFAGAPVSGLLTAVGAMTAPDGTLAVAYPLDVTVWLLLGGLLTRVGGAALQARWWRWLGVLVALALVYGLLLSLLVERA
jgi:hypothetical protein